MKVYQKLALLIDARENCKKTGNDAWFQRHTDEIDKIVKNHLPSGSGIDSGTSICLDDGKEASTGEKLVFFTSFHHMNESGMYDGWTDHTIIVTPSLMFGFRMKITGQDRNDVKEYLYDVYEYHLNREWLN